MRPWARRVLVLAMLGAASCGGSSSPLPAPPAPGATPPLGAGPPAPDPVLDASKRHDVWLTVAGREPVGRDVRRFADQLVTKVGPSEIEWAANPAQVIVLGYQLNHGADQLRLGVGQHVDVSARLDTQRLGLRELVMIEDAGQLELLYVREIGDAPLDLTFGQLRVTQSVARARPRDDGDPAGQFLLPEVTVGGAAVVIDVGQSARFQRGAGDSLRVWIESSARAVSPRPDAEAPPYSLHLVAYAVP